MKDAEERLKVEHRRVRLRNNRFLMGLALFAAGYLLLELDWIMIGALLYLAVILADMHRGQKELARAYAAEEEGCLQELNFWLESVSGRKPDEKIPGLVCGYREKEGRFSQCLLYREGENLYSLGSILEKHKVYSVSNQATYLLSIKKKSRRDAAQKLALSPEGWKARPEKHMAFLMQWASQEEKYSCLENFADDWLLQDLLEGKAGQPVGFARAKVRLKRQTLYECGTESGETLILTEEQRRRLKLA